MTDLDPQVQIRIIEIANKWSELGERSRESAEDMIKEQAKRFDQAYKAIVKTLEGN